MSLPKNVPDRGPIGPMESKSGDASAPVLKLVPLSAIPHDEYVQLEKMVDASGKATIVSRDGTLHAVIKGGDGKLRRSDGVEVADYEEFCKMQSKGVLVRSRFAELCEKHGKPIQIGHMHYFVLSRHTIIYDGRTGNVTCVRNCQSCGGAR